MYVYIYICVCICMYIYVCVCACVCMYVSVFGSFKVFKLLTVEATISSFKYDNTIPAYIKVKYLHYLSD